jgi:hypothetical protein
MRNANESEKNSFMCMLTRSANESQLEIVSRMFKNANVFNRNKQYTIFLANEVLGRKIEKKIYYQKIFESKSVNIVIYAPPQVGKTDAIIDVVFTSLYKGSPVLLTTDNKCNQLEQLSSRLKSRVDNEKIRVDIINMDILTFGEFKKTVEKCFERRDSNFVIVSLDNGSCIKKISNLLERLSNNSEFKSLIKQMTVIHDEADTVTKNEDVENSSSEQAVSHRAWIKMLKMLSQKIDIKRFFVTATPDNVVMKYDVHCKDVISLEVSSNYRGYKDIECIDVSENTEEDNILDLVKNEVIRIKTEESFEVIIYGIESYNGEQDRIMNKISQIGCIVHTYNMFGIKAVILDEIMFNSFYNQLWENIPMEQWDPMSIKENYDPKGFVMRNGYTFTITNVPLRIFYDLCQQSGETCIITIAKSMIGRSTSLVGETRKTPFAATVLFARPTKTSHQVANAQFLCRVSGCARPELKRKIYAPKYITDYFKQYNINQSLFIKEFYKYENKELLTKDIIDNMEFDNGTSNNIDRNLLKLKKVNIKDKENDNVEGEIDGVDLNKLKKWLNDNSLVGKMIRYLFDQELEITEFEFKEGIEYEGTLEEFVHNIWGGRSIKCQYGKLWLNINNKVIINESIKNYIKENNL